MPSISGTNQNQVKLDHRWVRIPKRFWKPYDLDGYVTSGSGPYLLVFYCVSFEDVADSVNSKSLMNPKARSIRSMILSRASSFHLDYKGRFQIDEYLYTRCGSLNEALWIFRGGYLELWPSDSWEKYHQEGIDWKDPLRQSLDEFIVQEGFHDVEG